MHLDILSCFAKVLILIGSKVDICQTDYSEVIHGSKTFKLTKD